MGIESLVDEATWALAFGAMDWARTFDSEHSECEDFESLRPLAVLQ